MYDPYPLMVSQPRGQSPWNLGEIKKRVKFKVSRISSESVNFLPRKLTMISKFDLKTIAPVAFTPR